MNQNFLYKSAIVVPITAPPIINGAILVRDGRIDAVGPAHELEEAAPKAAVTDFGASILMPPLVNAHTHLELTDFPDWLENQVPGARRQASGKKFVDWILQLIQVKHGLEPDDLAKSIGNGVDQLLKSGTGAVCDILSVHMLDQAYQDVSLHGWLCFELIGLDEGMGPVLPMMATDWLNSEPLKRLKRGLSPHAPYTVGPQALQAVMDLSSVRHSLATIHAAESVEETAFLKESAGDIAEKLYPAVGWHKPMPPYDRDTAAYLEKNSALCGSSLLVHGVQFDADAIRKIAQAHASVVLCPRSNARLGVGRAPVESYLCQGVNLALGTDSLASNDSLSLWDEMEYAREAYGPTITPAQLLAMATANGARALQIDDEMGAIESGMGANFLVLQPDQLPDRENVADFLCRSERGNEVKHLFLDNQDALP